MSALKKVWVFKFKTESGDEGLGPFWEHLPTDKEVKDYIQSNSWMRDEQAVDCLYYSIEEAIAAFNLEVLK